MSVKQGGKVKVAKGLDVDTTQGSVASENWEVRVCHHPDFLRLE